ncbi:Uu.00g128340.m01.CDS01 [Anthostomella pinea]|uniref:Uu.00g128340.m01.CDS01 n=1 Tax=Anthostomella pinea TaxID=933095 RepID=A0AAI8VJ85_9PEZI|nr:Uu.00g128340.m01.CDS01 [Anthostomella pinea]
MSARAPKYMFSRCSRLIHPPNTCLFKSNLVTAADEFAATVTDQIRGRDPGDDLNVAPGLDYYQDHQEADAPSKTVLTTALLVVSMVKARRQAILRDSALVPLMDGVERWSESEQAEEVGEEDDWGFARKRAALKNHDHDGVGLLQDRAPAEGAVTSYDPTSTSMANHQDPSDLFGLDDTDAPYYNAHSAGSDRDAPSTTSASSNQQFFSDPNWAFQDNPPYDTYSANPFYQDEWGLSQQTPVGNGLSEQPPVTLPPSALDLRPGTAYSTAGPVASPDPESPLQSLQTATRAPPNLLSHEQRHHLQKIAMPSSIHYRSPKSEPSPGSGGEMGKSSSSSPEDMSKSNSRKRKSSADLDDDDDDDDLDGHPVKKTAHNMIEKRYRTNLNDKIAALRDSVPSLRIMSKSARGEDTTEDREELQGLTPAHKLNKATVLSKATEYIRHLEKRNSRLMDDNSAMQQRIAAFEKLFMAGALNGAMSPLQQVPPATPAPYSQESGGYVHSAIVAPGSRADPQGMIHVPDDMKRILAAQLAAGQPYPVPQQSYRPNPTMVRQQQIQQQQQQQHMHARGWRNAGPYFGKLMVGSLAGLMLLEAVRENEQSNETPDGRGLFAVPIHLLRFLTSTLNVNFMGYSVPGAQVIYSIKVVLLLCSLWWALLPSLMEPRPSNPKTSKAVTASLEAVPSLASPIHVRRQAWLTAIQTVWVPRHNFFLEAAALGLKAMKLSLRNLIGVHGYQLLTGLTEDQEIARVKAWTIALDAQLAGGDVEISKSRLTLTLLASGTLPNTPLRLMLKALHIRVLLWEVSLSGVQLGVFNTLASKLARANWNEAKQLHRILTQLRRGGQEQSDDDLPDHLAALLEQDCDEVLNQSIVQRAHNLAWNHPTEQRAIGSADGMSTVVDDVAVRSPMDAVAAWWSNMTLQSALTNSLLQEDGDTDPTQLVEDDVSLAIRTAPIGSVAQHRALVARALLFDEKRNINIMAALQAIGPVTAALSSNASSSTEHLTASTPIKELPTSLMVTTEIRTSLLCAMAIAHLQKFSPPDEPVDIYGVIDQIHPVCDMGLLGYTATFKLMDRLAAHEFAAEACAGTLERLSGTLRIWTGKDCGLEPDVRHQMVERCIAVTRGIVGMDIDTDTGYGSMSESEFESESDEGLEQPAAPLSSR